MTTKTPTHSLKKWLPLGAITVALLLSGCNDDTPHQHQAPPPAVSVVNVEAKPVGSMYSFVARSEAVNQADILARVEGYMISRDFVEGGKVKKGQLLFAIDNAPFIAALNAAKAQLASSKASYINAKKNLARAKDLIRKGAMSQSDYDNQVNTEAQAAASVQQAQANLETAKINLSYTKITAPFDGNIGKSVYSVGNLIGPTSQKLATVTSMDPIYVTFEVDERQLVGHMLSGSDQGTAMREADIKDKGDFTLNLKLPNGQKYRHAGTFGFANTQVDETTGTLTMRATFPNPDGIILPGLYLTLDAESTEKETLPLIPQAAVQQNQSGYFVLVVTKDNKVETRQVTLGRRIGAMWAVEGGLKANERIIVEGLQKARPGTVVTPAMATIDPVTGAITLQKQEK